MGCHAFPALLALAKLQREPNGLPERVAAQDTLGVGQSALEQRDGLADPPARDAGVLVVFNDQIHPARTAENAIVCVHQVQPARRASALLVGASQGLVRMLQISGSAQSAGLMAAARR